VKLDVYGRFFIDVVLESGHWIVYRVDQGRRSKMEGLVIPDGLPIEAVARFIEDLLHEYAAPGRKILLLD
jgi:hypothetical protein